MVGGFLERNETIIEGARREIKEETGYESEIIGLFRIKNRPYRPGYDRQNISFVFVAQSLNKVSDYDNESTEVRWYSLNNLPPQEEFAFDHYEDIIYYLQNKNNLFPLSLLN